MFSCTFAVKHLKLEKNTSQSASQFESVTEKGEASFYNVSYAPKSSKTQISFIFSLEIGSHHTSLLHS